MSVKTITALCFAFSAAFSAYSADDNSLAGAPERLKAKIQSKVDCITACAHTCTTEHQGNKENKTAISECMTTCNKNNCAAKEAAQ